jgi:hypothetical protein
VSALNLLRKPCGVPGGPEVKARRCDQSGGHASASKGLICDRKTSDLASAQLPGTTGSTDCGFDVMARQARDRQFEYLNARQGALEDESGDEF